MQVEDKGVLCNCGKFHKFDGYYYAHSHYELTLKCECGNECTLRNGRVEMETVLTTASTGQSASHPAS